MPIHSSLRGRTLGPSEVYLVVMEVLWMIGPEDEEMVVALVINKFYLRTNVLC